MELVDTDMRGRRGGGVVCMCEGTLVMGTGLSRPSKEFKGTVSVTTRLSSTMAFSMFTTCSIDSPGMNIGFTPSASPGPTVEAEEKNCLTNVWSGSDFLKILPFSKFGKIRNKSCKSDLGQTEFQH